MDSIVLIPPEELPVNKGSGMDWISFSLGSVIIVGFNCTVPNSNECYKRVHAYQWDGQTFRLLHAIPEELKAEVMLNVMQRADERNSWPS